VVVAAGLEQSSLVACSGGDDRKRAGEALTV
jgi:hypothetical protein